jgi:hypothetical protein
MFTASERHTGEELKGDVLRAMRRVGYHVEPRERTVLLPTIDKQFMIPLVATHAGPEPADNIALRMTHKLDAFLGGYFIRPPELANGQVSAINAVLQSQFGNAFDAFLLLNQNRRDTLTTVDSAVKLLTHMGKYRPDAEENEQVLSKLLADTDEPSRALHKPRLDSYNTGRGSNNMTYEAANLTQQLDVVRLHENAAVSILQAFFPEAPQQARKIT